MSESLDSSEPTRQVPPDACSAERVLGRTHAPPDACFTASLSTPRGSQSRSCLLSSAGATRRRARGRSGGHALPPPIALPLPHGCFAAPSSAALPKPPAAQPKTPAVPPPLAPPLCSPHAGSITASDGRPTSTRVISSRPHPSTLATATVSASPLPRPPGRRSEQPHNASTPACAPAA
eukprot:66342-Chlamydomonas_euryale.AAC.1